VRRALIAGAATAALAVAPASAQAAPKAAYERALRAHIHWIFPKATPSAFCAGLHHRATYDFRRCLGVRSYTNSALSYSYQANYKVTRLHGVLPVFGEYRTSPWWY
jgi:hypothetical protein